MQRLKSSQPRWPAEHARTAPARPTVTLLDEADAAGAAAWDAFVAATPGASYAHLSAWRRILRDSLGLNGIYLRCHDSGGGLAAVLPLVRIRSRLLGHSLVSMPYLNEGGAIGAAPAVGRLLEAAQEEAERSGAGLLELRARYAQPTLPGLGPARRKVTVVLDLPQAAEELWDHGFSSKLRSQIRRPQKEGLSVRFAPELCEDFYGVFARNLRDLGTPVHPRSFFAAIQRELPGLVLFGVVYAGSEPVAAGCGFLWRGELEMTWAGALRDHKRSAPNMLLYWAFMEEGIRRGAHAFNFGRCAPGGGTYRFKQQWGGRDIELPWLQWPDAGAAPPSTESAGFGLASRAWQRLPVSLANRLGPALVRRIPTY